MPVFRRPRIGDGFRTAADGCAERGTRIVDRNGDIAHAVTVTGDVFGDGVARTERTAQDEPEIVLSDRIRDAVVNARLGSAVGDQLETKRRTIIMRGLLGIADVEFEMIESKILQCGGECRVHMHSFAVPGAALCAKGRRSR